MSDDIPAVDGRHPADVVVEMIEHVLDLAQSWPWWNGRPLEVSAAGEPTRMYTPHKACRRVADHLIDHLAEIEARLVDEPTEPDRWHGSAVTSPADLAPFTEQDLDEARSRLSRLGLIYSARLRSLTDAELDAGAGGSWTPREIAFHVAGSAFYADSVGFWPRKS